MKLSEWLEGEYKARASLYADLIRRGEFELAKEVDRRGLSFLLASFEFAEFERIADPSTWTVTAKIHIGMDS